MSEALTLAESATRVAGVSPDGLAIIDGKTRLTWREFDAHIDAAAAWLATNGAGSGSCVALLAPASADAIAVLHAIARIGAVAAPLGTGLTAAELAAAAAMIEPGLVVCGPGLEAAATALGRPVLSLVDLEAGRTYLDHPLRAPTGLDAATGLDAPATIVLTSGTTSQPRAVVLSAGALAASASSWSSALPIPNGWLLTLGLGHVAGLGVVWRAALAGVPLVILDRPRPQEIVAALSAAPFPSHVSVVPPQLLRLLDATGDAPPPETVRAILLGGGPIRPALVSRAIEAGWPVVPTYGLSEAGSGVTALPTADAAAHADTAGRPLPGVSIRISDPDDDGIGEILVQTPARFSGYLGDSIATASAITVDDWLRTGDMGRMDRDGRLAVLDRRTDRIVRGGENISPMEVEAVLLAHPAVAEVAIVARRDRVWGQVPVAAIVLRPDVDDPGDDALSAHCRTRLAGFKVPAAFFRVDALPKTPGGKVRRAELRSELDPGAESAAVDTISGRHEIARPGGVRLAYQTVGDGPIPMLLLHGALSTAGQLGRLARALAASGALTVHVIDRRGSGRSRLADPAPVQVATHVDDLGALLDAEACPAAILCGMSFGGVVALEFAARLPERALAVVAWEPPYGPLADPETQEAFARVAAATERAHRTGGAPAAAETFLRGVGGDGAWDRLTDRAQAFLADEGDGAYVDAGLLGLDPSRLGSIRVPTTILTGDASKPFYRPIAKALVEQIPGARLVGLPALAHAASITDPAPLADAVIAALVAAGVIEPGLRELERPSLESRP